MQKNPPKLLSSTFTPSLPFCLFLSPHASSASSASGWSSLSPPASSPSTGARGRRGRRRPLKLMVAAPGARGRRGRRRPLKLVAAAPGARGLRSRRPHLEFATFVARRPWLAAPSAPPWPPRTPKEGARAGSRKTRGGTAARARLRHREIHWGGADAGVQGAGKHARGPARRRRRGRR